MSQLPSEYMAFAYELALRSDADIPVGCIIVKDGVIVSKSVNEREKRSDPTAHAEILALREASSLHKSWRLDGCELYVTLEPCPMCTWAILNSRISKVYFGAYDFAYGALGSRLDLREFHSCSIEVYGGIMEAECSSLLKNYFKLLR